jgi:hypothetical protein
LRTTLPICPPPPLCPFAAQQALAPEEKLKFREGGPSAEARFEAGVTGYEARSFRGCGVVTSEPFEVSDGERRACSAHAAPPF